MENIDHTESDIKWALQSLEEKIRGKTVSDLRRILHFAAENFHDHELSNYFIETTCLAKQLEWSERDIMCAHAFVLYHIYLMYYSNIRSDECKNFLNRILEKYQQGKFQTH